MKTINVDLDGVVYPWHEAMANYIDQQRRTRGDRGLSNEWEDGMNRHFPEPERWNFAADWDLTEEQFDAYFRNAVQSQEVWWRGDPIKGSVDALWRLSSDGWNIRIITNRLVHKFGHRQAVVATANWLDKWNIPYWDLFFTGRTNKQDVAADAYIDDRAANLPDVYPHALLFDRKWNRESWKGGYRVNGWQKAYEALAKT